MLNNLKKKFHVDDDTHGWTVNRCSSIVIYVLITSLLLSGCSGALNSPSGVNYIYTYTMTQPQKNDQLIFRDNYLYIQFFLDASAISFQLQNISGTSIRFLRL
jgi:hypothetical protein